MVWPYFLVRGKAREPDPINETQLSECKQIYEDWVRLKVALNYGYSNEKIKREISFLLNKWENKCADLFKREFQDINKGNIAKVTQEDFKKLELSAYRRGVGNQK